MENLFKKLIAGVMVTALLITSFILPTSAAEINSDDGDETVGSVIGSDDRVESCDPRVVNVDLPSGARGTGFLVAKNIILTCRHCVGSDEDMKNLKVRTIRDKSYNVTVIAKGKWGENGNNDISEDWAILKADTTVCIDYFDISTSVSENDWLTTTGFPGDKKPYQTTESGNNYVSSANGVLVNTFDSYYGQSGSPVYKTIKDQDFAVGILHGFTSTATYFAMIDENIYEKVAAYRNHFTVKYYNNGGTGSMSDSIIAIGSGNNLKRNKFEKEGYVFKGWFANRQSDNKWLYERTSNGKTEYAWKTEGDYSDWKKSLYNNGEFVSATSSVNNDVVNMYAQWEEKPKYTVVYKANGGTGTMEDTTVVYGDPTPLRKNTFTKEGYTFIGWKASRKIDGKTQFLYNTGWHTKTEEAYGKSNGEDWHFDLYKDEVKIAKSTNVPNGVITLTAQWAPNYTIVYKANGGKGFMQDSTTYYGNPTSLRKNTFTREDCEFIGWRASRIIDGKTQYLYNTGWHTTTEAADGKANGENWYFELYTDGAEVEDLTKVPNGVITLTAQWKTLEYTVVYKAGGGKGTMKDRTFYYGVTLPMSKNTFTREGYRFVGWRASKIVDGKTLFFYNRGWHTKTEAAYGKANGEFWTFSIFTDGVNVKNLTDIPNGVVTMTAVWSKI